MDFIKIPNENVELLLGAVLSLFCVLTAHEIVEGLVVYSKEGLSANAIRNWALLRSHESLSDTINILRGRPLIGSTYHAHSRREENCVACEDVGVGKVMYKRYFAMLFVRIFLIAIEVAFIALSLTRKQYVPVSGGGVMVAWKGSGLGKAIPIEPKVGCSVAPPYNSSGDATVLSRLVYCFHSKVRFPAISSVNSSFLPFIITVNSGENRMRLQSTTRLFNALHFRAYWSTPNAEGLEVPFINRNITTRSNLCARHDCRDEWLQNINSTMKGIYGSSFRYIRKQFTNPRKAISAGLQIATGDQWPPLTSGFWTKERKLNLTLNILSSVLELTVIENGSSILYSQDGEIKSLPVDRAFLIAQPVASTGVLLLILILLLFIRYFLGCLRPNRYTTGFYSILKLHFGLSYASAPLTTEVIRSQSTQVGDHFS